MPPNSVNTTLVRKDRFYLILIFVIAVLIRFNGLGQTAMTADEYSNLRQGRAVFNVLPTLLDDEFDPNDWYFPHADKVANKPAVTIAYLVGLKIFIPYHLGMGYSEILFTTRIPFVLVGGLACIVLYLLAKELFDTKTALLSALMLALEPFHTGLSRIVGVDSVTTFFTLVTLWAFLRGLETRRRWLWLCISALAMGLGILTKLQTVIIVPILFTWIFFFSKNEPYIQTLKSAIKLLVPFCVIAFATFYLLWPWLWSPPSRIFTWLNDVYTHAMGGHSTFYLGEPTQAPGWSYYLVAMTFQLTGPEFLGIMFFLFFLLRDRPAGQLWNKRNEILAIFSWITLYVLFMSLIPKKLGARYVLAVFPAVLIFSSLGWISLITRLSHQSLCRMKSWIKKLQIRHVQILFSIALLSVQAYPLVTEAPDYYYDYFNPLLGGAKTAARVVQVGWGEGLNEIAQYFHSKNEITSKEHTVIIIGYGDIFNRYYEGPPSPKVPRKPKSEKFSLEYILGTFDYIVFQLSFVQRRFHEDIWIYFSGFTPEFTLQAYGLTHFWIFPVLPTL